jgi:hypothetical protein
MKFKIKVCEKGNEEKFWWEEYDKEVDDIKNWGKTTVLEFNNTLRPWEKERVFLDAQPMERKEKECSKCYGLGQVAKGFLPIECPVCKGTGTEEEWV